MGSQTAELGSHLVGPPNHFGRHEDMKWPTRHWRVIHCVTAFTLLLFGESGCQRSTAQMEGFPDPVCCARPSPDGKVIVGGLFERKRLARISVAGPLFGSLTHTDTFPILQDATWDDGVLVVMSFDREDRTEGAVCRYFCDRFDPGDLRLLARVPLPQSSSCGRCWIESDLYGVCSDTERGDTESAPSTNVFQLWRCTPTQAALEFTLGFDEGRYLASTPLRVDSHRVLIEVEFRDEGVSLDTRRRFVLIDSADRKVIAQSSATAEEIDVATVSDNGAFLFSLQISSMQVRDASNLQILSFKECSREWGAKYAGDVSDDGRYVVVGGESLLLWDTAQDLIYCLGSHPLPDEYEAVKVRNDPDIETGVNRYGRAFAAHLFPLVLNVHFFRDSHQFVVITGEGDFSFWNADSRTCEKSGAWRP